VGVRAASFDVGHRARAFAVAGAASRMMCIAALLACGHTTKFQNNLFRDDTVTIRVPEVPAEWRAIDVSEADIAFRDDTHEASVLLNGRCHGKNDDTPLVSLTNHLIIGTTEREIVSQDTLPFDGREAMHTVLRAKLDGVPMTYDIYVLKKDGCVFDFVYVAEPRTFASGAPTFERFIAAVHVTAVGEP
jgi:hypothetical protein